MTVLRELVAKLGFQVDESGFNKASAGVERIRTSVTAADNRLRDVRGRFLGAGSAAGSAASAIAGADRKLFGLRGRLFGVGQAANTAAGGLAVLRGGSGGLLGGLAMTAGVTAIGGFIQKTIDLASNANETRNILDQVFGTEGANRIAEWSKTVGTEVGRSKYTLRDFVGQLGAMIDPMVNSKAVAEEMSTGLAKLAVDLSSFFNTTESDALVALKAGLVGEMEPMRRYGVVLLDATLQEYAHAQGIHKKLQAMTVAEKAELRYRFIMEKTKTAQGDAARTGGEYANSIRALKDGLKDLSTDIGMSVMPAIKRVVSMIRNGIDSFREMAKGTNILRNGLLVLAGVATMLAVRLLAPFILPLVKIAALILLVDDLNAMFTGGISVVGHYIDAVFGIGSTDAVVRAHTDTVRLLKEEWSELWEDFRANWLAGVAIIGESMSPFEVLQTGGVNAYDMIARAATSALDAIVAVQEAMGIKTERGHGKGFLSSSERTSGRGMDSPLLSGQGSALRNFREREAIAAQAAFARREQRTIDSGRTVGRGINAQADQIQFGRARLSSVGAPSISAAPAFVTAPRAPATAAAQQNINAQGGPITIHAAGMSTSEIKREISSHLAAERRKTVSAIQRTGR